MDGRTKSDHDGEKCLPMTANATATLTHRVPPHAYFAVSAVFHYLGPSFAVLLFQQVEPLGVAWLRIAGAALVLFDAARVTARVK